MGNLSGMQSRSELVLSVVDVVLGDAVAWTLSFGDVVA